MKIADAIAWFDALGERELPQFSEPSVYLSRKRTSSLTRDPVERTTTKGRLRYEHEEAVQWVMEVETALKAVFPPAHPLCQRWNALFRRSESTPFYLSETQTIETAQAIVATARSLLKSGKLTSLLDGVRAETVGELLEQADALVGKGWFVAATVIAGGALETHLRHLCLQNSVMWNGKGSIDAYKAALDTERNTSGNEIITLTESERITSWGGRRNEAAHEPSKYVASVPEVRHMIEGIGLLVQRTSS